MKTSFFTLLFSLTFLVAFSYHDWTLEKSKNGVHVFTRPKAGSKFKEFKAVTKIDAQISTCIAVIKDVDQYLKWMHDAKELEVLKRFNENHFIYYLETQAPWPVENRDAIYEFKLIKYQSGDYKVLIKSASDSYKAPINGITRIKDLDGFWTFKKNEDGSTYAMFQMHANPGGNMPAWLVNSGVVESPFHSMENFKNRTLQLKK